MPDPCIPETDGSDECAPNAFFEKYQFQTDSLRQDVTQQACHTIPDKRLIKRTNQLISGSFSRLTPFGTIGRRPNVWLLPICLVLCVFCCDGQWDKGTWENIPSSRCRCTITVVSILTEKKRVKIS